MLPKYRHYRPKNLGVVRIDGRDFYLGRYDSDESIVAYGHLLIEHFGPKNSSIGLIIDRFTAHVSIYYMKNGRATSEQDNIKQALRFLDREMGISELRPKVLDDIRDKMIAAGRCRSLINKDIGRIRGMIRWAVSQELVQPDVYQALSAVTGLRKGRSKAKEAETIGPVALKVVESTILRVGPAISAMIRLQLLSGARPGEITAMRPCDISREEAVWLYKPSEHKTEHLDRDRVILLGARAQEVLLPWLNRPERTYCFVARPVSGTKYTRHSYRVAIQRGCKRAGVPIWTPLQLRHTFATLVRAQFGLEAAQTLLGHSKADVTQIYAERDLDKARQVIKEIG